MDTAPLSINRKALKGVIFVHWDAQKATLGSYVTVTVRLRRNPGV